MQRAEDSLSDRILIVNKTSINLVKGKPKKDITLLFLFCKITKELLRWGIQNFYRKLLGTLF